MHYTSMQFSSYYLWYGAINDSISTKQCTNIEIIYVYVSERLKNDGFLHFKSAIQISVSAPSGAKISQYLDEIVTF